MKEWACHVRDRIGAVCYRHHDPKYYDRWWKLDGNFEKTANEITVLLKTKCMPFFEQFDSEEKILQQWSKNKKFVEFYLSTFQVAILLAQHGNISAATALFEDDFQKDKAIPERAKTIIEIAKKFGISLCTGL